MPFETIHQANLTVCTQDVAQALVCMYTWGFLFSQPETCAARTRGANRRTKPSPTAMTLSQPVSEASTWCQCKQNMFSKKALRWYRKGAPCLYRSLCGVCTEDCTEVCTEVRTVNATLLYRNVYGWLNELRTDQSCTVVTHWLHSGYMGLRALVTQPLREGTQAL